MSEAGSTLAGIEVQNPNHEDALPDNANLSKSSELENDVANEKKEGDCNIIENVLEQEEEDQDEDFNPFLKENNYLEASSSLSSEVEDLDIDAADNRASMEIHRDSMNDCQTSGNVSEEIEMQTAISSKEVCATAIGKEPVLITQAESGSLCENQNWSNSMVEMDDEGAICMRTRARYSLASFTLDELENFLQESDDEDDLQNVDDEEEYRKFLAAVRGDDSQTLIWNANANDEDEENDADFELELEEALESGPEEVEERRMTRRNRCQKASLERSKKLSGKSNPPLRPLLPFAPFGSLPAFDGKRVLPNTTPYYTSPVNNRVPFGFTAHQIGQLHCLIHEHVQLLIQVFSLCVIEPVKRKIAAEVKELAIEMVRKRGQALACRTVPYPSFCFLPPYVHPSLFDGVQKMQPPKDSIENAHRDISTECTSWVPYISGPVLSVVDVAPLRLVEVYMKDVSSAVRAYERDQIERGFEFGGCQKEPMFPLHNFPCSAKSDDQGEMENNTPDSSGVLCASPNKQIIKKTMAATLLEKTKNETVAVVPKEIAKLAQRFWPLLNPALYPHKPPPAALVKRVFFTDAEDELLAMGLMECNTDWKAIQQRFLPCKSWHQIFVRQKNRASSKAPENPIKAVRRMKNSPLTSEEIARVEMGLKRLKLDWISIWRSFVPYRDPSLLPRQWRSACGTQKTYKSDPNKKKKRRLYDFKRRSSKFSPSTWHSSSEKEGDSYDNAVDETNSGDNRIDKEDEAYVHEAFLADWRQDDNNVSSSILTCMPSHSGSIRPQTRNGSISSQAVVQPYTARRQDNAHLVKLAPGLPPVNLPPSVRIMSQSAFKSSEAVASSKISGNSSRIADLAAGSSVKSGPSRNNIIASSPKPNNYLATIDKGDLQMHPLLYQSPQDGNFPYYPVHNSTSTSTSFTFSKGMQPQQNLGFVHNPRHLRNPVNFLSKSSMPPEKNVSSSSDVVFHPLLQRGGDVGTHSIASDGSTIVESRQRHAASMQNSSAAKSRNVDELDLDIHLSSTSKNREDFGRRDVTTRDTGRLRRASHSGAVGSERASEDSGKKRDCARDGISREVWGDESLPGIIMEQEELSDSEEESGENVEFECEEMADSEGDSMEDSEQIANEEVLVVEMNADNHNAPMLNTESDYMYRGSTKCSTSGGHSRELEPTGKGVNIEHNVLSLNLNFIPPVSPLSAPTVTGYECGSTAKFDHNQLPPSPKGSSRRIKPGPRNPRKRVCRSNSSSTVVRSGKVRSSTNVDSSVGKLKEC